jgi:hypothetical protein
MEPDFAKSSFCQDWLEVAVIQIVRVENRPLRRGEDEVARFVISRLLGGRSLKKLGGWHRNGPQSRSAAFQNPLRGHSGTALRSVFVYGQPVFIDLAGFDRNDKAKAA